MNPYLYFTRAGAAALLALSACSDEGSENEAAATGTATAADEGNLAGSKSVAAATDQSEASMPTGTKAAAGPAQEQGPTFSQIADAKPEPTPASTPAPTPAPAPAKRAPDKVMAAIASEATKAGPPAAFAQCAVCHAVRQGAPATIGPNLFGVGGRKAASLGGYAYSPALTAYGGIWNHDRLDKFIEAPMAVVPDTKMTFAGQKDSEKRAEIVTYLLSLK